MTPKSKSVYVIVAIIILLFIYRIGDTQTNTSNDVLSSRTTDAGTLTVPPTPTLSPLDKMMKYNEGQYKIGKDIPAGEYVLLSNSSSRGGYFCVSSDANADNILAYDYFGANSIITVIDGEYLELTRCTAFSSGEFYEWLRISLDDYGAMLKVGYDIPAGEYKLETNGKNGYYRIYSTSRQDDIVSYDYFNNTSYVSVENGQYLSLGRCKIIQ